MLDMLLQPRIYVPCAVALGLYLALWITKNVILARLRKISKLTETHLDDLVLNILSVTRQFFIIGVSLYAGLYASVLRKGYGNYAHKIFIIILSLQIFIWGKEGIQSWIDLTLEKKNDDPSVKTSLGFLGLLLRFVLIALVLLTALNNLGYNVSTFITGLGVGGVAIALATQNILGDLFSSLSIVLDKPFVVGDFISLGEWAGTIEHVGLKTTRIRSLSGEQVIVANSDLLKEKIRNYKRMEERRVVFKLGMTYGTSRKNLKLAPRLIEDIIKRQEKTRFDRAHFLNYGAYSLDFEVVYYVLDADFNLYADIHQKILLEIHEAFENHQLEFAFPTQTLLLEKGPAVS